MASPKFTHLHVHTEYSLLDGLSKIHKSNVLFEHVKSMGMDSVAITDHGAMYGAVEFYQAAKAAEVKPILGLESYITDGDHTNKNAKEQNTFHLLLLAKNLQGYKNLMKLTSIAQVEGYYYRPRIDHEVLKKYSEGIICTSTCIAGEIPQAILNETEEVARKKLQWYLDVFKDDFYIELQRHQYAKFVDSAPNADIRKDLMRMQDEETKVNDTLVKLSREMGVPLVATNDAHYIKKEDATAQDALVCVSTGKNISDMNRLRFIDNPSFYINSPEEMAELFPEFPDALENTNKIAEKCEVELTLGVYHFPKFVLPEGKTAEDVITEKSYAGIEEKYGEVTEELKERIERELDVINSKGYAAYFLIYQDMANWCHKRHIPINIRGSVAGSLVSYALGITTVDPIRYNLPFERFLNPYRPSAPDIDMDIADDMRDEMIQYLKDKYGEEKVAQICTFGRMLARGAVRDIARVMGYPYEAGDRLSKMIPEGSQGFPMTMKRALEESEELKNEYNTNPDAKKIIELAKQVEGNARHVSMHAGGVVISPTELTDFTPIQNDKPNGDKLVTQYEMHAVEEVGLVKLDILGLRNLSILRGAVQLVRETTGEQINLQKIPIDDKKTYEMLSKGETMGVFQLSGSGMTRYLVELEPQQIEDIMMMIALFRPGPMDNIDEYIARKRGKKPVVYYHPKMEKFLDKSLGVLVYQDDLLYTAIEVAGYDWGEVDKFRKAVGKKIPEEMARQHEIFVEGCMKHSGMSKEDAEGLWKLFEPFQGYGFNKAHSASYGFVAYQTAWMKANYPVEYMAALMTAEHGDLDKVSAAIAECRRMGIKVLPPDINESSVAFTVIKDDESLGGKAIRFGLSAIKNVGNAAIEAILEARKDGNFVSFSDFCARIDSRKVNKKVVESLIKVGALSQYGSRAGLLDVLDEVREKAKNSGVAGQQGLFMEDEKDRDKMQTAIIERIQSSVEEFPEKQLGQLERELLGISLSAGSVFDMLAPLFAHRTHKILDLLEGEQKEQKACIACMVSDVRVIHTKKTNAEMAFAKVEDDTGGIDVVIFPKIFEKTKDLWATSNTLLLTGKIDERDDSRSLLVDSVDTPESATENNGKYQILIPKGVTNDELKQLINCLSENKGTNPVYLIFDQDGNEELQLPFGVTWSQQLSVEVAHILKNR